MLKALNLLLTMKLQDVDFEFPEFVPKIDLLRDQLRDTALPLQTLAALWRHYEAIGAYARAEDSLCALLEAEPDNAALVAEAKTFYERLLLQSDYALESGNLPRAEAEAGLAELTGQEMIAFAARNCATRQPAQAPLGASYLWQARIP